MLHGKIYMLSSPNHPKTYIGSTIQPMNVRLHKHRSKWNSCSSKKLFQTSPESVKVTILENIEVQSRNELQYHEVQYLKRYWDTIVNRNMPHRDRKQRYQDNIDRERKYQRQLYATEAKKNGGSGNYRQLQRYHDQKESILRHSALQNAWKMRRLPNKSTMIRHCITEEDVAVFNDKMRNP